MGKKRRLELDTAPLEEKPNAAEARFEKAGRRLELKSADGADHKEFSHQTGTVQVDDTGVMEYRERQQKDSEARAFKAHRQVKAADRINQMIDKILEEERDASVRRHHQAAAASAALATIVVFCAVGGIGDIYELFTGFKLFGALMLQVLLAMAVGAVTYFLLKEAGKQAEKNPAYLRAGKIAARFAYAFVLIYLGISGVIRLINLFRNPPARGVLWGAFFSQIVMMAIALIGFRYLWAKRKKLKEQLKELDSPALAQEPAQQPVPERMGRDTLELYLYTVEGLLLNLGFLTLLSVMGFNIIGMLQAYGLSVPMMLFLAGPFLVYLMARMLFRHS